MRTVLVFGTFDGVHLGHDNFFRQAKELGDRLIVIVALDETVLTVKGRKPVRSEQERLQLVDAHPLVDEAHLGSIGDKYAVIQQVQPDVIALGYDQVHFVDNLEDYLYENELDCDIIRLKPFRPDAFKSSIIDKR